MNQYTDMDEIELPTNEITVRMRRTASGEWCYEGGVTYRWYRRDDATVQEHIAQLRAEFHRQGQALIAEKLAEDPSF